MPKKASELFNYFQKKLNDFKNRLYRFDFIVSPNIGKPPPKWQFKSFFFYSRYYFNPSIYHQSVRVSGKLLILASIFIILPLILTPLLFAKLTLTKKSGPETVAVNQSGISSSEGEVLAVESKPLKGSFSISVPFNAKNNAFFKQDFEVDGNGTFKKDLTVQGDITASNLIYSLTASDGISLTAGQSPTIKNTGVLSLGGKTGALKLEAGTGVTIDGVKITNSDPGSSISTFKTVTVGSTSFSAGSSTDTLTFAAGTGMSVAIDTTNKKLTLSASAADLNTSGFTDGGTSVYMTTTTDSLGIGTTSPSTKLHVVGTTEQLRLGYDSTNYTSMTISSGGDLTIAPSGSDTSVTGTLGVSGATTLSTTLGVTGNTTITGDLAVNGGDLTTTGSTFNLVNTTATTLNIGGAATAVSLGASTGTSTINNNLAVTGTSTLSGATTIAPSASGATSLTLRASTTSPGNILNITNSGGDTSYMSISSAGALTVGGSTLTNSGLLESGGAIHLTNSANAVVGTAIEGGWTMSSNTFTYRRTVTVTNNDGATALPVNYEVTVSLSGSTASQIYSNAQSDYDDFRIAYSSDGVTFTEIARNVTSFTSSSVAFTYQLSAEIAASGSSSNYYIYYKNSALSTPAAQYASYTGNVQIDSLDTTPTSNWTSVDTTQFPLADEATVKNEGSGSLKASATVDNIGTFSTTSQNALPAARTNFGFTSSAISGTTYLYAVGGSSDGTAGNGQTTVYRTSAAAANGNVAAWSTNANSLSAAVMDNSVAVATPPFDSGTGSDGAIDLANGSGAGGCTGTGLSWSGSTCTIATATKSTFNFTTVTIPVDTTLTTDGPKTTTNFVTIKATGAVTIAGTINLAGKGYRGGASGQTPGYGSGGGACSSCQSGGGAGYGGAGGQGGGFSARTAAGATYSTDDSGSGGGTGQGGSGGGGGGGIKIISGGTVTASGTINTNGSSGTGGSNTGSGGGSGGRIYIQAATLTISGSLTANGGNGADGTPSTNYGGGGGGGGRITLEYSGSLDTTGSTITVTNGTGGAGTWTGTASGTNGSAGSSTNAASSPALYVLGGKNTSGAAQSGISQSTLSTSDGSAGAFSASAVSLPQALYGHTSNVVTVGTTNYLYIVGGNNGTSDQTTVYKGTFSGSNISAIATTSQTQLGTGISYHATVTGSISSTNYIWVLGGLNGSTAQTSVYRGTIDASGNITALSTTSQGTLPQALYGHKALFVTVGSNNYIYVYGGMTTGGTRQTTVYKATVDASGNVGTFTTVGQTQFSTAISDFGAFNFTDSDSNQYAYIVGGNTGTVQTAVMKTKYTPIDQTGYSMSRTISSSNWSNKNDLTFQVYSSRTGSYMNLQFYDATGGWQTCTFTVSSANTWETKTCDISGVSSVNKDAVTSLKVAVSSSTTTAWTMYLDDINAKTEASTISNTASSAGAVLGAANLTLNAQGTGSVLLNYDTSSAAGTGGFNVYNGGTTSLLSLSSTGDMTYTSGSTWKPSANSTTALKFGNAAGTAQMTFDTTNGYLGIGVTPSEKLHLASGNLRIGGGSLCVKSTDAACAGSTAGTIYATTTAVASADVAENYISSENLEPGDLVALAADGNSQAIVKTTTAKQKTLIGAISTAPGLTLNSDVATDSAHPKAYPVALAGRVPLKVSLENGPIKTGDSLTSSSTPGYAMKAKGTGVIIGIALEDFSPSLSDISQLRNVSKQKEASSSSEFSDLQSINLQPVLGSIEAFIDRGYEFADYQFPEINLNSQGQIETATRETPQPTPADEAVNLINQSIARLKEDVATMSAKLALYGPVKEASSSAHEATISAELNTDILGLNAVLEASDSAQLSSPDSIKILDATISGTLKALGETFLGKTTLAGDLSVDGTLSLTGNSINSLGNNCASNNLTMSETRADALEQCNNLTIGILYIQNNLLSNLVDLFNGQVKITKEGKISAQSLELSDNVLGTAIIKKGETEVTINAPLLSKQSKILITPSQPVTIGVTNKDLENKQFKVNLVNPLEADLAVDWWIIEVGQSD